MTVSICALLATYNRADFLKESLDTIFAQTYPIQQVIVISDGCTDNTEEIVRAYGDRILFLTKPNGGKSSALNLGLQSCTSDYIWICDDDDLARPEGLGYLAHAIEADPSLDFVFGHYQDFRDQPDGTRTFVAPRPVLQHGEPSIKLNLYKKMVTNLFAALIRTSLVRQVGGFNEQLPRSQDYDMALRIARNGQGACIPDIIFYYRQHDRPRGGPTNRFTEDQLFQKWFENDQKIFTRIATEYALDEFTPTFALNKSKLVQERAALIQRSCTLARRGLWDTAIDGLDQAATKTDAPLLPEEKELIANANLSWLSWAPLWQSPPRMKRLHATYQKSPAGHILVALLCRLIMTKRLRRAIVTGDVKTIRKLFIILRQMIGIKGILSEIPFALFG